MYAHRFPTQPYGFTGEAMSFKNNFVKTIFKPLIAR